MPPRSGNQHVLDVLPERLVFLQVDDRRRLTDFSSQTPVLTITDTCPPVGDNGDRPVCQRRGVSVNQDGPEAASQFRAGAL